METFEINCQSMVILLPYEVLLPVMLSFSCILSTSSSVCEEAGSSLWFCQNGSCTVKWTWTNTARVTRFVCVTWANSARVTSLLSACACTDPVCLSVSCLYPSRVSVRFQLVPIPSVCPFPACTNTDCSSSDTRMLEIQQYKRRTHGFCTFSCFGPHIWNSLLRDLTHCSTLSSFKAKLKTFLFSQYFRPNWY